MTDYTLYTPERHPALLQPAKAMDWSNYFQRQPATLTKALNDRLHSIERHPDLLKPGKALNLSDWFQRHLDSTGR